MTKNRTLIISTGLLVVSLILMLAINLRGEVFVVEKRLDKLPDQIGRWHSRHISIEQRIVEILDTDAYINRVFYLDNPDSQWIALYIGYYGTAKGGRTGHNPYACLPSQGRAITQEKKIPLNVSADKENTKSILITRLTTIKSGRKQLIYHWYQASGEKVLSSGIEQNLNRFFKRIFYNRNDGAYIQVSLDASDDLKAADALAQEFIKGLFPLLIKNWPLEIEKKRI